MSTRSSSASSSTSLPFKSGDYYRVLLLNTDEQQNTLLLHFSDGQWDLPYFEYPEETLDGTLIPDVCRDLQSWLGLTDDHVYFTGTVELLGDQYTESKENPETVGRAQLLLVEAHGIKPADIHPPEGAQWKVAEFIPNALPDPECNFTKRVVRKILNCLEKPSSFLESLSDERYRPGWFEKASHFLMELASRDGAQINSKVVQRHMSFTSTLLRVDTSLGNYFLKSPASGCNETKITAMMAKLFPNICPYIVGASEELNCFVSREFEHKKPEVMRDAVLALGQLQLESIDHLESLEQAGCPVRNIEVLSERCTFAEWPQMFRDFDLTPVWLVEALPFIEELSTELKRYKIPMTLVHGDFSAGNIGFAERNGRRDLILFDWEYAYIGHPFFDFHRVHKHVPESVREEYLKLWSSFEHADRARRVYEIAKDLGWVMKLWSMLEWASKSNAQHAPLLAGNAAELAAQCYNVFVPLPEN